MAIHAVTAKDVPTSQKGRSVPCKQGTHIGQCPSGTYHPASCPPSSYPSRGLIGPMIPAWSHNRVEVHKHVAHEASRLSKAQPTKACPQLMRCCSEGPCRDMQDFVCMCTKPCSRAILLLFSKATMHGLATCKCCSYPERGCAHAAGRCTSYFQHFELQAV